MNSRSFGMTLGVIVLVAIAAAGGWLAHAPSSSQPMAAAPSAAPAGGPKILYYRNPMGLPDTSPTPKKDTMGMDYLPVYADAARAGAGTVSIDPAKMQTLGVRTAAAGNRVIAHTVRAVGTITFDERRVAVVNPKFEGWITTLHVNTTGQQVRRGEPLLEVYSPDLVAAEQEYIIARDGAAHLHGADSKALADAKALTDASLARLRNWDIPTADVDALARTGKVTHTLTLRAPSDGTVTDKPAVEGMHFASGDTLFRIADLSQVWVVADVFEQDLATIKLGASAHVQVNAYPGDSMTGTVAFIYPTVNRDTRTARVRIELANPGERLKSDMYGQVEIETGADSMSVLAVPESAVIDGGTTQTVLVEKGAGRYEPHRVKLGRRGDGYVEVQEGLNAGDQVVVGANFLIDAESNLRAALQSFTQSQEKAP